MSKFNLASIFEVEGPKKEWYEVELNTANLVQAVVSACGVETMSADSVFHLLRLTCSTYRPARGDLTSDRYIDDWPKLKIPALAALFGQPEKILDDLRSTIKAMRIPPAVALAAGKRTGIASFRQTWRKVVRKWCHQNEPALLAIIGDAVKLGFDSQARFDLAVRIESLPDVYSMPATPDKGTIHARAATALTPLIACIDPQRKFPIINSAVKPLLKALSLGHHDLETQVRSLVGIIGDFSLSDAFMIDTLAIDNTLADHLVALVGENCKPQFNRISDIEVEGEGSSLPYFDESEREAVHQSETVQYRDRHDKMTNGLKGLFAGLDLERGLPPDCRYDVLVKKYDAGNRDLLIEVKPDADRGSIRIAIGQLFDYRRGLSRRAGTDLALLTISSPPLSYIELLNDLQISALWFEDEDCQALSGTGKAWRPIEKVLSLGLRR